MLYNIMNKITFSFSSTQNIRDKMNESVRGLSPIVKTNLKRICSKPYLFIFIFIFSGIGSSVNFMHEDYLEEIELILQPPPGRLQNHTPLLKWTVL